MLSIKHLEAIPLNVPFYHERVSRHMHRALTHGERVYVTAWNSATALSATGKI